MEVTSFIKIFILEKTMHSKTNKNKVNFAKTKSTVKIAQPPYKSRKTCIHFLILLIIMKKLKGLKKIGNIDLKVF